MTGFLCIPSCAQVIISSNSSIVPYPPKSQENNLKVKNTRIHVSTNNKYKLIQTYSNLPGRAMNASASRAISAFLSCMSETIFTSPTVSPDIYR